jgi:hypothetical protein
MTALLEDSYGVTEKMHMRRVMDVEENFHFQPLRVVLIRAPVELSKNQRVKVFPEVTQDSFGPVI